MNEIFKTTKQKIKEYNNLCKPLRETCIEMITEFVKSCEDETYLVYNEVSERSNYDFIYIINNDLVGESLYKIFINDDGDVMLELESTEVTLKDCYTYELVIICEFILKHHNNNN